MKRTVAGFSALLALTACKPHEPIPYNPPTPVFDAPSRPITDPVMYGMPDCEDQQSSIRPENLPCVTFDEDDWRVVESYTPYRHVPLAQCKAEDGGPILPCVWKNQDQQANWLVFTKRPNPDWEG